MAGPELTIWAQSLDGLWQPLGSDLGVEVVPESWTHELVELGGPSTASFQLRRHTRTPYSDLGSYTPILAKVGGVDSWAGRIVRTPKKRGSESVWDVECEGWYAHLNDDVTNKGFVHRGWEGWRNVTDRSTNAAFDQACSIELAQFGYTKFHVPTGNTLGTGQAGRIYFDAGPGNVIERVVLDYRGGGAANLDFQWRADSDDPAGADEAATIDAAAVATGLTTFSATFATPRRYFSLQCQAVGGNVTGGTTAWVRVEDIQLFTSTAYESGDASTLTLSDVIRSDLSEHCPLISSNQSLIEDSSTAIPHYWPGQFQTPRERLESLLPFETQQFFLRPATTPVPVLRSKPTTPMWVYDASTDGGSFNDAGANDGQEMFNQALPTYTDSAGVPQASVITTETGSISLTNGTFDVDANNWTATTANTTIARDTTPVYSGAGSLAITCAIASANQGAYTTAMSAATIPGRTYTAVCRFRCTQSTSLLTLQAVDMAGPTNIKATYLTSPGAGQWKTLYVTFVARGPSTAIEVVFSRTVALGNYALGEVGHIDEASIELHGDTLIDRRGFKRTKVLQSESSTSTAATALADNFLDAAQFPPFKGSLDLTGYVRKYGTDEFIPVGQLPAGDLLMVLDETNPTTGGLGRVGTISRVAYSHSSLTASVDLDSREDIITQLVR